MTRPASPPLKRFVAKISPEPNTGCWIWLGHIGKRDGYGQFRINPRERATAAHRAAFLLHKGQIPDGLFVCHKCDVRSCVNPAHLFLGTASDNMADAAAKGRMKWKCPTRPNLKRGEQHHSTPLTAEQVLAIRSSTDPGADLARRYGITPTSISRIRRGLVWRHLCHS